MNDPTENTNLVASLGDMMKRARKQRGLSLADLSYEMFRNGNSKSYLSKVENGGVDIRMSTFIRYTQALRMATPAEFWRKQK
jgi:transcriptional regulator with XRE-family HTH domain